MLALSRLVQTLLSMVDTLCHKKAQIAPGSSAKGSVSKGASKRDVHADSAGSGVVVVSS
jgi:hypothetical protein